MVGSVVGWAAELLFRRFLSSANPERKWINPGFCVGPYLPLYGIGTVLLYLISMSGTYISTGNDIIDRIILFVLMGALLTVSEYIAGILLLKVWNIRLWDYSKQFLNIQGLICPKFSLLWTICGIAFYYILYPRLQVIVEWFYAHDISWFFVGIFFGVFLVDLGYSTQIVTRIRKFAKDNGVIVRYEHLKAQVREFQDKNAAKHHFLFPLKSDVPLNQHLMEAHEKMEKIREKVAKNK